MIETKNACENMRFLFKVNQGPRSFFSTVVVPRKIFLSYRYCIVSMRNGILHDS